jgi:HEAT repeat protein
MLKGFNELDTIAQIVMLDTIKDTDRVDLLPDLMDLYATPQPDQAVEEIVYYTLFTLLAQAPDATLIGLRHPAERVRLLAIQRAGEDQLPAALPILVQQLQTAMSPAVLDAIIMALSKFHGPDLRRLLTPFLNHEDDMVAAFAQQALDSINRD